MIRVHWIIDYQDVHGSTRRAVPQCYAHVDACITMIGFVGGTVLRVRKVRSGR